MQGSSIDVRQLFEQHRSRRSWAANPQTLARMTCLVAPSGVVYHSTSLERSDHLCQGGLCQPTAPRRQLHPPRIGFISASQQPPAATSSSPSTRSRRHILFTPAPLHPPRIGFTRRHMLSLRAWPRACLGSTGVFHRVWKKLHRPIRVRAPRARQGSVGQRVSFVGI